MFRAILRLLLRFFPRLLRTLRLGEMRDRGWRNYHLVGAYDCPLAVLFFAGLSASTLSWRGAARRLHREKSKQPHIWMRSLWGHTGYWRDFHSSRMWSWVWSGGRTLTALLRENRDRRSIQRLVLSGHSTGALVALVLGWLYERFPRLFGTRTACTVELWLMAPPFALHSKRDERLLDLVLVLYYVLCPLSLLVVALRTGWLAPLCGLIFILHICVVPHLWVPSGTSRAEGRREDAERFSRQLAGEQLILAIVNLIYIVLPLSLFFLERWLNQTGLMCVICGLILTLLLPLYWMPRLSSRPHPWQMTNADALEGWQYLPVITTATLRLLQRLALLLARSLRSPVTIILFRDDDVIDNRKAERVFQGMRSPNKRLIHLTGSHSDPQEEPELLELLSTELERQLTSTDPVPVEEQVN